jgi:hypothetical protein
MGLWLWVAAARAECGDPELLLGELEAMVLEGRFAEAEAVRERLVGAFGCGELAAPEQVARMWLAEALVLGARDEQQASDEALAAAARIAPSTWTETYGPAWKARWQAAAAREAEPGRVELAGLPEDHVGAVDGAVMSFPATLPPGPHLLQVLDTRAVASMRFELPASLDLVLEPVLQRPRPGAGGGGSGTRSRWAAPLPSSTAPPSPRARAGRAGAPGTTAKACAWPTTG